MSSRFGLAGSLSIKAGRTGFDLFGGLRAGSDELTRAKKRRVKLARISTSEAKKSTTTKPSQKSSDHEVFE